MKNVCISGVLCLPCLFFSEAVTLLASCLVTSLVKVDCFFDPDKISRLTHLVEYGTVEHLKVNRHDSSFLCSLGIFLKKCDGYSNALTISERVRLNPLSLDIYV